LCCKLITLRYARAGVLTMEIKLSRIKQRLHRLLLMIQSLNDLKYSVTTMDATTPTTFILGFNLLLLSIFISVFVNIANAASEIDKLTALINQDEANAQLYIRRADIYFQQNSFFDAVEDYTTAIELDPGADQAYFGRGMANARQGYIDEGIADLSVYIERHPDDSRAYTKRGVRYLWKQDFINAEKDLTKAVELDNTNAEAHDDLGVVLARKRQYPQAIEHFRATIQHDPSYQKAYHNLALTLYLAGQDEQALLMVNHAVALNPNHRDALMLKSQVLKTLGRPGEAAAAQEAAEFLPETNWSEAVPVE
jgi:tetratricopeptide (TPR) repeat protein